MRLRWRSDGKNNIIWRSHWESRDYEIIVVQSPRHVRLLATPWTVACQAPLSSTISWSLLKFISIELLMLSNHLILCRPLSFCHPASGSFPMPKYRSFSFSISPSNKYSGLISFRIDWFDLLAVQGTLKSLLQHHSSKASIVRLRSSWFQLFNMDCLC